MTRTPGFRHYWRWLAAVTFLLGPVGAGEPETRFVTVFSGANEVGPNTSPATGTGVFVLNAAQTELTFDIDYSGLTGGTVSGAHFHNAAPGVNGPIVRGVPTAGAGSPNGTLTGVWTSTDAQPFTPTLVSALLAGSIYFNIHTNDATPPNFPGGEIRGQLGQAAATTLNVTRSPSGPVVPAGTPINFTATVLDQVGAAFPGAPVTFTVNGSTGNDTIAGPFSTDAQGQAFFSFTPLFSGSDTITVSTPGVSPVVQTVSVGIAESTPGAHASGHGFVDALALGEQAFRGLFHLDARVNRSGRVRGELNFTVPGVRPIFRFRSTRIESLAVADTKNGRLGQLAGVGRSTEFGAVRFRADALDGGPDGEGDRFLLTLLSPDGKTLESFGGNLRFTRVKGDVRIREGVPTR